MVAEAEIVVQSVPLLDLAVSELELRASDAESDVSVEPLQFIPSIRSGSFADIGPRRYMEDEHIRIDDLSAHLGSITCPTPSAFYGVFDGHGGPEAAAYLKKHAVRFLFEDADFPQASQADEVFLKDVENSIKRSYLLADHALAEDCTISSSSGTTALTATVFGRFLVVANVGDCRAVLCRNGEAVDMSKDHRPSYAAELQRVEELGGYVDRDGYLNGVLSVTRALGDWDIKMPQGSPSPLIAEPEFRQAMLTEEDEFLVIGCDGIWDVMSSQEAVSIVRRGLIRHDNPVQCARELITEALRLKTSDNLTVIIVCFTDDYRYSPSAPDMQTLRCCKTLSMEAICDGRSSQDKDCSN